MIITKAMNKLITNLVEDKLGVLNEKRCKKDLFQEELQDTM